MITRREFSKSVVAVGTALLAPEPLLLTQEPQRPDNAGRNQDYDLVIKGGTVVDPGQKLHAVRDIALKDGKIFEVSENIPEARARQIFSAKGKIVTPGLIDLHVHCYDGVTSGVNADHYSVGRGT